MNIFIADFIKNNINKFIDILIILYIKSKLIVVFLYFYHLKCVNRRYKIIYARCNTIVCAQSGTLTTISSTKKDCLNELITYFEFDNILSCASLQRWFRDKYNIKITSIEFIYLRANVPTLCVYDLNNDDGLSRAIDFSGELDYVKDGDISIE